MIRLLVVTVLTWAQPAWAQSTWLHVLGYSWHDVFGYNARNRGIGIEIALDQHWSVAGGMYLNSIYRDSIYALAKRQIWTQGSWFLHINTGVVSGYTVQPVVPVLVPELCWHWVCAIFVPNINNQITPAAAMYLRIPL